MALRTDGLFEVAEVKLPDWTNDRTLNLLPFGDVHRDSPSFADEHWDLFLTEGRKPKKDRLFLGMGDYLDSYSTSERSILSDDGLHESTLDRWEEENRARVRAFAKEIEFMRGRLIGLLGGNHFIKFQDGTTSDQYLAQLMGCRYLGACCAIQLSFQRKSSNSRSTVQIFAHHGKGGGTTAGGRFNSVEQMAKVCIADIYLMGDNHARGAIPMGDRLRLVKDKRTNKMRIDAMTPWVGRTGSFLKAYNPGKRSYVVDKCLPPSSLGWIELFLTYRQSAGARVLEIKSMQ